MVWGQTANLFQGVPIPSKSNAVNADEQPIPVTLSTRNKVDGVESDDTGTFLTSGILSIPLDKVFATFAPPVQASDAGRVT